MMASVRYGAAQALRCGAALFLRSGAVAGRLLGAGAAAASGAAAAALSSAAFPRAQLLLAALLVGLRCGAAPGAAGPPSHNALLRSRLLPSVGRLTFLLVGSLLVASLPLVRPASARWGALWRAAGRSAVTSAIMAAAAPPLFASIRSAVGLSPSPHAFALVLCGLAMGEELGPLGKLLHRKNAGRGGGGSEAAALTAGSCVRRTGNVAANTGSPAPSASTPHFLLFLLNAALLLVLQAALVAVLSGSSGSGLGAGLGEGLGAGLGWAGHALTYGLWFRCPYSPGKPAVGLGVL